MSDWCFAGPKENWEFGIEKAVWATNNEFYHTKWFQEMKSNDRVIVFLTRIGVIGYCQIKGTGFKTTPWWPDELSIRVNLYPNVIYLEEFSLVSDIRDNKSIKNLALKSKVWKKCGLTQRHIIGGINKIKNENILDKITIELQSRTNNNLVTYLSKNASEIESKEQFGIKDNVRLNSEDYYDPNDDRDPDAPIEKVKAIVEIWKRNKSIIIERKRQTANRCEIPSCTYTPFIKPSEEKYSEAHHIIPLGQIYSENINNIAILCPNHHREIHFGKNKQKLSIILKELRGLK